jgi:hypothetical protein
LGKSGGDDVRLVKGNQPQLHQDLRLLMHWAGETNIAAACHRCAAQLWAALALIGIRPEN